RGRGVRVGGQQRPERVLVELPDLRAHLLERLVPGGELAPADLAAAAAGAAVPAQGGGGVRARRRRAVSFSPAVRAGRLRVLLLRRRRALRPDRVEDLVDDRLRRAVD